MKSKQKTIQSLLESLNKNDDHEKFIIQQIESHLDEMYNQYESYELFVKNDLKEIITGNELAISKVLGLPLDVIEQKIENKSFSNLEIRFIFFYLMKWLEGAGNFES